MRKWYFSHLNIYCSCEDKFIGSEKHLQLNGSSKKALRRRSALECFGSFEMYDCMEKVSRALSIS